MGAPARHLHDAAGRKIGLDVVVSYNPTMYALNMYLEIHVLAQRARTGRITRRVAWLLRPLVIQSESRPRPFNKALAMTGSAPAST